MMGDFLSAFPDLLYTFDQFIAKDDYVVERYTATGTQQGALGDIPPSGRIATWTGINIVRKDRRGLVRGGRSDATIAAHGRGTGRSIGRRVRRKLTRNGGLRPAHRALELLVRRKSPLAHSMNTPMRWRQRPCSAASDGGPTPPHLSRSGFVFKGAALRLGTQQKRDTKNGPLRQEAGMAPPLPNSAHGDRLISAKPAVRRGF